MSGSVFQDLPYAGGRPPSTALLRERPEDFQVVEELPFEPSGEGEHMWLLLRKCNTNTVALAQRLARIAGVRPVDVGYAGLKDRRALTTQWFSVNLSGKKEPRWESQLEAEGVQILEIARHSRKLRRGVLRANRFLLTLRQWRGDRQDLNVRLARIKLEGVPNYFGSQRFGQEGRNLVRAEQWFAGGKPPRDRFLRGLLLSSARAFLFNKVLADRVQAAQWNQPLCGDVLMRTGSRGFFLAETVDGELQARVRRLDCHPSGPLWGQGELPTRGEVRALETQILAGSRVWREGLERQGLKQERRSLRLVVAGLLWSFLEEDVVQICFRLPAGAYATTVLREVVIGQEAAGATISCSPSRC